MPRVISLLRRIPKTTMVGLAGFALAAVMVAAAVARTFTLTVASKAKVTNVAHATTHLNIVTFAHGRAVYTLSGDSRRHPECTKSNTCFKFWPPVTVSSAKKLTRAPGIKGRLGTWRRNGFDQVTLNGHPLYTFSFDHQRRAATGEGIKTFGGTWHVIRASGGSGSGSAGSSSTSTSSSASTTTSSQCLYPPCT